MADRRNDSEHQAQAATDAPTRFSADGRYLPIRGHWHDPEHPRCHGTGCLSMRVFGPEADRVQLYDCSCRCPIPDRPNFDRDAPHLKGMTQDELDAGAAVSGSDLDDQLRGVAALRGTLKAGLRRQLEAWIARGAPAATGLAQRLPSGSEVSTPNGSDGYSVSTIGREVPAVQAPF